MKMIQMTAATACTIALSMTAYGLQKATTETSKMETRFSRTTLTEKASLNSIDESLRSDLDVLRNIRGELSEVTKTTASDRWTAEQREDLERQIDRNRRDARRLESYLSNTVEDLRKDADRLRKDEERLSENRSRTDMKNEVVQLSKSVRDDRAELQKDIAQLRTDEQRLEKETREIQRKVDLLARADTGKATVREEKTTKGSKDQSSLQNQNTKQPTVQSTMLVE
jgi:chromosome segregation ATPase